MLLVDEAFADSTPELSLAAHGDRPGLVVLRSFGKFFGLGVRLGFVLAPRGARAARRGLGPWTVGGPARWRPARARRHRLARRAAPPAGAPGRRLAALLRAHGLESRPADRPVPVGPPDTAAPHAAFARRGILLRRFNDPPALRFGLPADEPGWARLEAALAHCPNLLKEP